MSHLFRIPSVCPENVFLLPTGNNARHWNGDPIPATKIKDTHKYIYVVRFPQDIPIKVLRSSYVAADQDSNGGYLCFPSLAEFSAEKERREKLSKIRDAMARVSMGAYLDLNAVCKIYDALATAGLIRQEQS